MREESVYATGPRLPTLLAAVAAGGAVGALARYGFALWIPPQHDAIPWSTLLINSIGCFAIGVLMVCVTEAWTTGRWANPLVRPFLGTGILGGFTTFSTYTDEIRARLDSGATAVAFTYLAGSIMLCLGAVAVGMTLTRYVIESTE